MRIAIREQLALLVLFTVLVALTVVSVPTWLYVNDHIAKNLRTGLSLTASLKASRITSELELIQNSCLTISSRILLQDALQDFYDKGEKNWASAKEDIDSALSVGMSTGLLQARIYSRNTTGPEDGGLFNVTASNVPEVILPYKGPDGEEVTLNNTDLGYPPMLYPNITYVNLNYGNPIRPNTSAYSAQAFPDVPISRDGGLLLGPLILNETSALISISVAIRDNTDHFILGYMTIVAVASAILQVRDSREGLDDSGMVLIVGPTTEWNRFPASTPMSNATYTPNKEAFGSVPVRFVLPPASQGDQADRHSSHNFSKGTSDTPFPVKLYPAVLDALTDHIPTINNASSMLDTHNEQGVAVAVGYARTQTPLANWTVIVEKSKAETYQPINTLRDILLGTVFGTAGFLTLLIIPCAHFGVLPIRRLKAATEKSISPPGYEESFIESDYEEDSPGSGRMGSQRSKKGVFKTFTRFLKGLPTRTGSERDVARRMFKIPGKVDEGRHFITDELTELTSTFNDMSDELVKQYMSLEEKVAVRTKQLSESKKAAEAANESKTLFIANISHELKTPLNGIMGMCAVCMEETDIGRIKQSLKTLYESGDLLLHLLEDLLSFSKNQIGQQLTVEVGQFQLIDIRAQILSIFDKQVREGQIDFSVNFLNAREPGDSSNGSAHQDSEHKSLPAGLRLEEVSLWGDQHRILQVIINLVNNSLKFTPVKGKVEVRIRCLGEDQQANDDESRASSISKSVSRNSRSGRMRYRGGSASAQSTSSMNGSAQHYMQGGTALSINPMDPKMGYAHVSERSPTPPPQGTKAYIFEFVVQDTGPGIPPSMQEKVFEPFVQGDLGLSRKFGGTGLGLSICHQLAGLMGGSIHLDSTEGVGSTFTMLIPLKCARSTRPTSMRSPRHSTDDPESQRNSHHIMPTEGKTASANNLNPQPRLVGLSQPYFSVELPVTQGGGVIQSLSRKGGGSKLRVLVADDNSTNIEVVSRMLKLEDVSDVTVAKDGQEAYDLVKGTMERNEPFDVIFMDVQMPNVDGLQSTRLIRGIGYKSPIVALTAFSEESNVKECINSGMDEFLSKPIRRPALKQVLKRFATIPEETEGPTTRNDELLNEKRHHTALNGEITELPTPPATTDDNDTELFSGAAPCKAE
ncbi:unnamed protein product [Clonostachys solani]|uniref:histidine kinase n=1 Tax=Clonostachys solani TaxID=160281 RepID=A0A9P0ER52_9HYPO|nr:unnamed protein product [Clonostachys solani]